LFEDIKINPSNFKLKKAVPEQFQQISEVTIIKVDFGGG